MLVNEWVESFWAVLNVRPKTLHDYKRLYKRHLAPSIGENTCVEIGGFSSASVEPKACC